MNCDVCGKQATQECQCARCRESRMEVRFWACDDPLCHTQMAVDHRRAYVRDLMLEPSEQAATEPPRRTTIGHVCVCAICGEEL